MSEIPLRQRTTTYKYDDRAIGATVQTSEGNSTYFTTNPAGGLVGLRQGGNRYYYIFDGLGSVVGLTDSSGTLINTYSYDPYGNILSQSETVAQPYKFTGTYYDTDTGLYKMGARYYDPAIGRFTQADPIALPNVINGGFAWFILLYRAGQDPIVKTDSVAFTSALQNIFIYAGNSPVNATDKTGYMPRWLQKVTGALLIVGGVAAIVVTVVGAAHGGWVGLALAIPAVYAEIGLVTEGINRLFDTSIPDLLPIFGP